MSRVVRGAFPDREFDVAFWQQQGNEAIFGAAWEMVVLAEEFKGSHVELNQNDVKYLIVGSYAVMKYTEPFYTKDMDIWIDASPENAQRTYRALTLFGAPLADQFGIAPVRVDVMTSIDAVAFDTAWQQRVQTLLSGIPISIISLPDLIRNKEAAGRDSDRLHLKRLRQYGKPPQA